MEDLVLIGIVTIVVIVIGLRVFYNYRKKKQLQDVKPYKSLPCRQAYKLIQLNYKSPEFTILDIRSFEDYKRGHLLKSINIDYNSTEFKDRLEDLSKDNIYLLYCNNGTMTHKHPHNAMELMEELGFKKVVAIHKGFAAWKRNRFPIVMGEN